MSQIIIADADGAIVEYDPGFLDPGPRSALLAELAQVQDRFDRDRVRMYGKTLDSPRLVCAFGDDGLHYRYAGVDRTTHPWPPHLRAARDRIADLCGHPFNYALVNLYRDGDDYIGWHADKVSDLAPGSAIASLSLGAARPFQLRHKQQDIEHEVLLASGSLLVMRGTTQQFYKHALPRRRGVTESRFNVTFRHVRAS
ncbi:alpha-ketoglutarate-dependent dioxygenase AlkB family protein [Nannocystis bainbridge]|uniref:Alpha-ketoglutarate-dependent dioxygenase AlkB n=1 Tax=Nannocystis bainbridge TaxID=2995303 RepID=A0ABT5DXK5_9BACT|nr:alpha-ketoglutarate-dependent dioxygenase AlkB [Nannocystis bainbridge]MDC0717453.1 alpha-ketoglutarate-dependent dioxygenase AlkB [Nannocystis bainbridge]